MTYMQPEQDNRQIQTQSAGDTAEHFEFLSETLLPDLVAPQHNTSRHSLYPYAPHYTGQGPGTTTPSAAGMNPCRRPLSKLSAGQPNLVPMTVPFQRAVVYPGYNNCAVYPAPTRGSFSCLNRQSSEVIEQHGNESASEDNNNPDSPPPNQGSQREVCRYFMRTGTCGYGDRCRYHHPQSAHRPTLNSMGYPQREGEHACPFYLKNGWCGFGATCKFNHPELPPLNVPVTTMMPPLLTHVSYSAVPPYANVPTPSGAYPVGTPTPMIHHPWPVPTQGVALNVPISANQQTGQSRPYIPSMTPWSMKDGEASLPVEWHGIQNSESTAPVRVGRKGASPKHTAQRHLSPGSEDSAYSAVMGRGASLPLGQLPREKNHDLISGTKRDESSRASVTNP